MIEIFPDLESMSRAAARLFVELALAEIDLRGRFDVILTGGNTPLRTYELLAGESYRDRVPWANVHVYWTDERFVPHNDPRSNYGNARKTLLDRVPIPRRQIHPMPYGKSPRESAEQYETMLRKVFADRPLRFDLVFMGLGANGHTASLFPGTPVLSERKRWVAEVFVPEQQMYRITLTVPVLNAATVEVFLVSGEEKAAALHDVLEGDRNPIALPAQSIDPTAGKLLWFADRAAAKLLQLGAMPVK